MLATLVPGGPDLDRFLLVLRQAGEGAAAAAMAGTPSRSCCWPSPRDRRSGRGHPRLRLDGFDWAQYVTIVPPLIGVCFCAALAVFAGLSSRSLEDQGSRMDVARVRRHSADVRRLGRGPACSCSSVPHWVFTWKTVGRRHDERGRRRFPDGPPRSQPPRRQSRARASRRGWAIAVKFAPAVFIVALGDRARGRHQHHSPIRRMSPHAPWWDHAALLEHSDLAGAGGAGGGVFRDGLGGRAIHQHQQVLAARHVSRPVDPRVSRRVQSGPRGAIPARWSTAARIASPGFAQSDNTQDARAHPPAVSRRQPDAEPGGRQAARMAAAQGAVVHGHAAPLRQLLPRIPAVGAVRRAGSRWERR